MNIMYPSVLYPTTPQLARNLKPYISQTHLIVPNTSETTILCDMEQPAHDRETGIAAARKLISLGATVAVVTMGERGLA